ncbi:MAG: ASPIC/UnbV domain-containing protein, partial [Acidobacteria bacterium]|nr:ASPIC/UnbV domain-containing protein [Acidobacteriota bacterium]
NRDGIGAVVSVTPDGGNPAARPVLGGASYASQDSLQLGFGLGDETSGLVEVLWPGGILNRAEARSGETLVFPEIPCDYSTRYDHFGRYVSCVARNLGHLVRERVVAPRDALRFLRGALSCEDDVHRICTGRHHGNAEAAQAALTAF